MTTFKLFKPANLTERETLPTKSFVKLVGEYVLVIIDKDYGDKIKIHGEKSDVILSKIDIKSNIILNNMRQVTISCDTLISSIYAEITILLHIKNDHFSKAAVYVIDKLALSDAIGYDNLTYLDVGTTKLIETFYEYNNANDKTSNFIIVNKLFHKKPLVKAQMHYGIPDDFIIITDRDYGENIIISKNDKKVTLTRMNVLSRMNENTAKKLYVLYFRDDTGILHVKSFDLPGYYFEPTAYVTSSKEFVSAIGECNFYWLVRGKRAFSLYDSKYAKTYSMNFEAINKVCPSDTINILYKVETVKTKFDNMDILKENMKSFIKEVKNKYNISYSEWNCKVYIKSYSYYSGEYAIEEKYDLNSEAF